MDAIIWDYHRNGFALIPGFFSAQELEQVRTQVQQYLERQIATAKPGEIVYENPGSGTLRCVFRMHEHSPYFDELMRAPRLLKLVGRFMDGAEAVGDGVMLISKLPHTSYEFPYHQDNAYQFWHPPDALAATLALDESTAENGAIVCLQGSHLMGILPHHPSGVRGASRGLVEAPDTSRYPEVTLAMKPGDLSLHHVNVIHRTGPNRTGHPRRNLGFAYHARHARRDEEAFAQYEQQLKQARAKE